MTFEEAKILIKNQVLWKKGKGMKYSSPALVEEAIEIIAEETKKELKNFLITITK